MKKVVLWLLLATGCGVVAQEKKNDTIVTYYDGLHKVIDLDSLKDTDEIILPVYRAKYFYMESAKTWVETRCRLKDNSPVKIEPILTLPF